MSIWMDLTFSMRTRKGKGIVGITRAELELASKMHRLNPEIRFFVVEKDGFYELTEDEIGWLFTCNDVGKAYLQQYPIEKKVENDHDSIPQGLNIAYNYYGRPTGKIERVEAIFNIIKNHSPLILRWVVSIISLVAIGIIRNIVYVKDQFKNSRQLSVESRNVIKEIPFGDNDLIFSAGMMDFREPNKEFMFSELRNVLPGIKLVYVIYDLIYVNEDTYALYPAKAQFENYLNWISYHCDYVVYGGKTAQQDAENYWKANGYRIPVGKAVAWGSDAVRNTDLSFKDIQEKFNIKDKYILAVGSIDTKKNYEVLYRAYSLLTKSKDIDNTPQLVISGNMGNSVLLNDLIRNTPDIVDLITVIQPNDDELAVLYKECLFFVLPSWWEGWSLTVPEALSYGKFCILSDIAPFRELAKNLAVYINPSMPAAWANAIYKYSHDEELITEYETRIKEKWNRITWEQSAQTVLEAIKECINTDLVSLDTRLCFDVTTAYHMCRFTLDVGGILRTELILLRYLCRKYPHMRLFAFADERPMFISRKAIECLLDNRKIDTSYKDLSYYLQYYSYFAIPQNNKRKPSREIYWLICSLMPSKIKRRMANFAETYRTRHYREIPRNLELPFNENDILLSVGSGFDEEQHNAIGKFKESRIFSYIPLMYDYTPVLYPQFHTSETIDYALVHFKKACDNADLILYGGKTAEKDGRIFATDNDCNVVKSYPVYFGADSIGNDNDNENENEASTIDDECEILKRLGIKKGFVLVVGTIQPRKNHEILYLAYLDMLRKYEDIPQMVFAGFNGWKMGDLVERISRDKRVKGKLLILHPNDNELDILYKHCLFTVLASIYEGWSLTLPESYSRGKFCICTDTPPLRETAGELADYVDGYDVQAWSDKIQYYYVNREELEEKEKKIKKEWHVITWYECSEQIAEILEKEFEDTPL